MQSFEGPSFPTRTPGPLDSPRFAKWNNRPSHIPHKPDYIQLRKFAEGGKFLG